MREVSEKKKVVMIVEAMLGGIRQHVCDIVESLDKETYEIYIIYSDLRADETFEKDKTWLRKQAKLIKCNAMKRSIGKEDYVAYKMIIKILREIQPDIVHCHSSKAGIVGRLAAKKCKVPLIIYTPNAYAFQNPETLMAKKIIYILGERFLSRYATSMTINVSKGEMYLARKYRIDKAEKFTLIYNGIPQTKLKDKRQIRKELGLDEQKYYVGVTARCEHQKDPYTFLKIAEKVVSSIAEIEFVYIGNGGMQEEMNEWIVEHGLKSRVHMLGFRTDAAFIVGGLDLYLSTALYEGLPYSMIEAMRAGVPIIATNTVGNNELVFEGINGKMFAVKDVDMAYKLIMEQYKEQKIKPQDVKNTFVNKFSTETMMKNLERIYCEY